MVAKISYYKMTIGCQKDKKDGHLIDWSSGGPGEQIVQFDREEGLTDKVAALKAFKQPFQFGNSFTYISDVRVEIIQ